VHLFRYKGLIFGDGCYSGAIGPLGFSTTTSQLSYYNKLYYDKFCPTMLM
jgi:hypothetical protein